MSLIIQIPVSYTLNLIIFMVSGDTTKIPLNPKPNGRYNLNTIDSGRKESQSALSKS